MSDSDDDRVEYEEETIKIGSFSFEITTVSQMPIHILMQNAAKGVEISGQKIWCGSLGVCQYLMDSPHLVRNNVIVELGAGTGLLGMLCKRLGAAVVNLTDNDPRSIEHMRKDCSTNNIDAYVTTLDWFHPEIDVSQLNRNSSIEDSSWEALLLAGDVLYKKVLLQPFFKTARQLLIAYGERCKEGLLLCHIPRADVDHDDVINAAGESDLLIREIDVAQWRHGCATEHAPPEDYMRAKLYNIRIK